VKKLEWWGAGVVICLERGTDLHMAQLMPLPLTVQIGFRPTFLVLAHPGSPGQRPVKRVCVCVCVCVQFSAVYAFSALMLLVGRREGHPACKTEWWNAVKRVCVCVCV